MSEAIGVIEANEPKPATDDKIGFTCPRCKKNTKVSQTFKSACQSIYRKRACKDCKIRFSTVERLVATDERARIRQVVQEVDVNRNMAQKPTTASLFAHE